MAVWGARQVPIRPDKLGAALAVLVTAGAVAGSAVAQAASDKPAPRKPTPAAALSCPVDPATPSGVVADATGTATFVPGVPSLAGVCAYSDVRSTTPLPATLLTGQQSAALVALLNNAPTTSGKSDECPGQQPIATNLTYTVTFRYGLRPDVTISLKPSPGSTPASQQKAASAGSTPASQQKAASAGSTPASQQKTASAGSTPASQQKAASAGSTVGCGFVAYNGLQTAQLPTSAQLFVQNTSKM